ncbi:hypothetical protein GGC64_006006 [Mycobacterium sp. OAS707]|nr:hypothetical protein [Mycobacterium sp. OAS707]
MHEYREKNLIGGTLNPTDATSGLTTAQPCGSRIRHEYEKNASAILMRILQIRS